MADESAFHALVDEFVRGCPTCGDMLGRGRAGREFDLSLTFHEWECEFAGHRGGAARRIVLSVILLVVREAHLVPLTWRSRGDWLAWRGARDYG